jgi:hypothetical protein
VAVAVAGEVELHSLSRTGPPARGVGGEAPQPPAPAASESRPHHRRAASGGAKAQGVESQGWPQWVPNPIIPLAPSSMGGVPNRDRDALGGTGSGAPRATPWGGSASVHTDWTASTAIMINSDAAGRASVNPPGPGRSPQAQAAVWPAGTTASPRPASTGRHSRKPSSMRYPLPVTNDEVDSESPADTPLAPGSEAAVVQVGCATRLRSALRAAAGPALCLVYFIWLLTNGTRYFCSGHHGSAIDYDLRCVQSAAMVQVVVNVVGCVVGWVGQVGNGVQGVTVVPCAPRALMWVLGLPLASVTPL